MPAVSVIVLVYKVEQYIERCARALFEQTLEDLEYVFVDDCTPDASMDVLARVLEDYPARRSQVKILHNEVNRGQAYSRRRGIEAATGDYIIHCDSDDWPELTIYEKLYLKAKGEGLDMVICKLRRILPDHTEPAFDKLGTDDLVGALLRQDIYSYLFVKLVSRRAYEKGIVYPQDNMSEDTAIIIQLACNCTTFGYIEEELYNYVVREDSISYDFKTIPKLGQMRENYNLAIASLEAKGLARRYKKDIVNLKCWLKSSAFLLPREYYINLYPEVNFVYLFNRRFSLMQRLGHLTKLLGIHGISKVFRKTK